MNDNEDPYKVMESDFQGFTSLIIRESLVRSQLGPRTRQSYRLPFFFHKPVSDHILNEGSRTLYIKI